MNCTCKDGVPAWDCPQHCPVCINGEEGQPHWCHPRKEFLGDATMGALMFEEHYGDPAPREAI